MKRLIFSLIALGAIMPANAQGSIVPLLDCVTYNFVTNAVTAYFGYVDTNTVASGLPIGIFNFFDPPPSERNQITAFQPGVFHKQFSATFLLSLSPFITWNLDGFAVTASNDPTLSCGSAMTACWDTNGNGICDPSEDINGDGVCNALDCQGATGTAGAVGAQGQQGPAGVAGATGPPGISPAIQVVTVPSTTANATASCNANQVLLNGGGTCAVPNTNSISGRIASSAPSGSTGWAVSCSLGNATAVALCAPAGGN